MLIYVGPTSFAPVIDAAISIVEKSNWQYHVLVIVADGQVVRCALFVFTSPYLMYISFSVLISYNIEQVTRNPDTPPGKLSFQEQATINSIVAAR